MLFLKNEAISRKRSATGTNVNGIYTAGSTTTTTGKGSVQPLKGEELQNIPENQRNKETWKVYTKLSFIAGDIMAIGSIDYQVFAVEDWYRHPILAHYKVYIARLNYDGQRT